MSESWTDDRVERLKKLTADGWSASRIAEDLNVSRNAVIGKAHRNKLFRPPVQPGGPAAWLTRGRKAPLIKPKARGRKAPLIKPRAKWEPKEQPRRIVMPESFSNNRISILELREYHCRWIHDDGLYCGNPKINNTSYCLQHHSICYRKATR